jgi:tripartite-type tricarboxylate transporter receptor subunit TctC
MREAGAGDLTIVPYSGSKTVVNALRAGDISLGWIGSGLAKKQVAAGNLECLYTTDPTADNYVGKTLPGLKVPDFTIGYVVYTNTKNEKLRAKLENVANDPEFKAYMEKSLVFGTFNPTQEDLDHMAAKVDRMSNNWIDKK